MYVCVPSTPSIVWIAFVATRFTSLVGDSLGDEVHVAGDDVRLHDPVERRQRLLHTVGLAGVGLHHHVGSDAHASSPLDCGRGRLLRGATQQELPHVTEHVEVREHADPVARLQRVVRQRHAHRITRLAEREHTGL